VGRFVKGEVVIIPFPFSDLSNAKKRPALVVCDLPMNDLLLCQITSRDRSDGYSVELAGSDFASGGLSRTSYVRFHHLFTGHASQVLYPAGTVSSAKMTQVIDEIVDLLRSS
jgi:mRNA interferase MazF